MPTTIRTSEPRELLALVPFQLGFQPEESAVVVSLRGPRRRVGLVARVDLTALADPVGGPEVARALVAHLVADGARGVVLVLYSREDRRGSGSAAALAAAEHLADAGQVPLGEPTVWVVTPDGWYGLGCLDLACCPADGRPLAELQSTAVGAEMVVRGAAVAASRADLARVGTAPPAARRSARRAAVRWAAHARAATCPSDLHRWRRDGLTLWRTTLDAAWAARLDARPTVLGRLRAALDDVLVRDAVLLLLLPGTDGLPERVVAGDGGADVGEALRRLVDPSQGVPPDRERCAGAAELLALVAAHAGQGGHAPSTTLLAVLAWWAGDGARAAVLLERALATEPTYRLARLVEEAVACGMPPGWLSGSRP